MHAHRHTHVHMHMHACAYMHICTHAHVCIYTLEQAKEEAKRAQMPGPRSSTAGPARNSTTAAARPKTARPASSAPPKGAPPAKMPKPSAPKENEARRPGHTPHRALPTPCAPPLGALLTVWPPRAAQAPKHAEPSERVAAALELS